MSFLHRYLEQLREPEPPRPQWMVMMDRLMWPVAGLVALIAYVVGLIKDALR